MGSTKAILTEQEIQYKKYDTSWALVTFSDNIILIECGKMRQGKYLIPL